MLSAQDNQLLTRIGSGTPCGNLMRRYWQPVAARVELDANPVKKVRIMGEDLVLYRDRQQRLGLVGPRCPHRAVDLQFGIQVSEIGFGAPAGDSLDRSCRPRSPPACATWSAWSTRSSSAISMGSSPTCGRTSST